MFGAVLALLTFGLLAIYSATVTHPTASGNFQKQLFFAGVGIDSTIVAMNDILEHRAGITILAPGANAIPAIIDLFGFHGYLFSFSGIQPFNALFQQVSAY